ncbi:MAG: hypothetical protein LBT53_01230, partial [Puniceicoccales bacterium]|nr:hypothetical protein [Puniceicoccales bacterium]
VKNERHRQIWADTLAEAARHCAKARVRVAWWELWNEPDGIFGQSANARYLDLWRYYIAASRALKGVDPTLQIGGPGLAWPHGSVIFDYFKHCGKDVDFISYHQYSTGNYKTTTRQFLDNAAPHFGKEAASISRSIKRAAAAGFLKTPTTSLPIFLTEYNMNYGWDPGEKRQQTPAGVVYTAIALFEAGSNGLQRAAIWSAIGNSQFGLVHGDHTAPSGYLLRKLADWAPGNLVKTTVGVGAADAGKPAAAAKPAAPLVRAYATADAGTRHLTVVLINTSETQTAAVDLTLADGGTSATAASAKNFGQAQVFVVNADNPAGAARVLPPPLGKVALPPLTVKVLRFGGR